LHRLRLPEVRYSLPFILVVIGPPFGGLFSSVRKLLVAVAGHHPNSLALTFPELAF
jgi:hypothetical protein